MNYTSKKQSKKLVELGLNPNTADMYYDGYGKLPVGYPGILMHKNSFEYDTPCWSLGALMELMPKVISVPVDERSAYFYRLEWQFANDNSLRYITTDRGKCLIDIYSDHDIRGKSLIETVFEMVIWLLENNYIKTEKK